MFLINIQFTFILNLLSGLPWTLPQNKRLLTLKCYEVESEFWIRPIYCKLFLCCRTGIVMPALCVCNLILQQIRLYTTIPWTNCRQFGLDKCRLEVNLYLTKLSDWQFLPEVIKSSGINFQNPLPTILRTSQILYHYFSSISM